MKTISRLLEQWYINYVERVEEEKRRERRARVTAWENALECHRWASELGGEAPYKSGMVRVLGQEEEHYLWQR